MTNAETPSARGSINDGILALGKAAPNLESLRDYTHGVRRILSLVDDNIRAVFDQLDEAKRTAGLGRSAGLEAYENLTEAAGKFGVAQGSSDPEREALPQKTRDARDSAADFCVRLGIVGNRIEDITQGLHEVVEEIRSVMGSCNKVADVNGEINQTLIVVSEQSRIAAELSSNL